MQIKVLVVDDSRFYRNRLCEIISRDQDIEVVGTAENGSEALEKVVQLQPDVITMDIEMPVMDGISAVREIMKKRPTPILMFSSLTAEGAQATLNALDAGAVDFLLKRLDKISYKNSEFANILCDKLRVIGSSAKVIAKQTILNAYSSTDIASQRSLKRQRVPKLLRSSDSQLSKCQIVVIGASTGGPVAIQSILSLLPSDFSVPILIVQHMPGSFTGSFARRLNNMSELNIKEALDGDAIEAGNVYVAPGGKQMVIEERRARRIIRIRESYENEQYKPSVDITYKSISDVYGDSALAIILTGMGVDGREGAAQLKRAGSEIWAQNEETCVVFGMPQAVIDGGFADRVLPITEIASQLVLGA